MTKQITLEEALELVDFWMAPDGYWQVETVKGDCGIVKGSCGIVKGSCGTVEGQVFQTINGRGWQYIESPKEKLKRLIEEGATKEQLLEAVSQMEDN